MSQIPQSPVTRWWWVRHAPVVDAHLKRITGQSDVDADVTDAATFQVLAQHLPSGAVWFTSDLKRTAQTAKALMSAGAERVEPLVEPAWAEQNFGDWTGLTWDAIGADQPFWDAPTTSCPPGEGSESFTDQCDRVAKRVHDLNKDFAGRDLVCVAHAGTIRAAVAQALGLSPEQALAAQVDNLSLTRLDYVGGGNWRVVGLNQVC